MRFAAIAAIAALMLAQAFAIGRVELTFDEAYYALWARWPQAGYLDHPPMVAWIIAASQALFGRDEFGVRALFWLMGASLPALVFWIGWLLFEHAGVAAAAALIFVGAPLVAGAPLATPDTPLVFFWTLALAGLAGVWRGRAWGWALVGFATGAAGLAKMTAGFLAFGIALALAVTPSLRPQWRRRGPWIAAVVALGVLSPFLVWNATHGFATLLKQGGRIEARAFRPHYLAEFLLVQLLLFNPLTAATAAVGAWRRRGAPSEQARLLVATVAPALAYFALHALHDRVQGNWPAPLYPALALLAARATWEMRWPAPTAAALGVAAVAAAYLHLATGLPRFGPSDPFLRIGGWRALSAEVFSAAKARGDGFVVAQGYAATSLLSFYGPPAPQVVQAGEPERWAFRPPVVLKGEGLAFGSPDFADALRPLYPRVKPLQILRRRVSGVELEPYVLFSVGGAAP